MKIVRLIAHISLLMILGMTLMFAPCARAQQEGAAMDGTSPKVARFKPAIIYGVAGKFDKSFNEAAYKGAERFKQEFGIDYREAQITTEAQSMQLLRELARKGYSPIFSLTAAVGPAVDTVSKEFPNTLFTVIDTDTPSGKNVQTILFKDHEGSFLVGMAAALATKTGSVGFIGGMDGPFIRSFGCGYAQGVKYVNKDINVMQNMVGNTYSAFKDPARGAEIAKSQFSRGADVVFVAATFTGVGVLQAAKDAGKLAIGCNTNQNSLQPGSVLTSMVEHADNAIYQTFLDAMNGTWKPGNRLLGLKEKGVDWALDKYNRGLISTSMEKRINAAKADIIDGKLKVVDYRENNSCPVK